MVAHEAPDVLVKLGDLLVLAANDLLQATVFLGAQLNVLVERSGVGFRLPVAHFDDLADRVLQELAVVRDDEHRTVVAAHPAFQPLDPGHVEVVGGLVEDDQVGFFEQQPGDGQPRALAAAQRSDPLVVVGFGEAHLGEDRAEIGFDVVAFGLKEAFVEQRVLLDEVGVRVALHAPFEFVKPFLEFQGVPSGFLGGFEYGKRLVEDVFLAQVADARAGSQGDAAAVLLVFARDEAQQGGFAAAVAPDQADLCRSLQAKGSVRHHNVGSERLGHRAEREEHGYGL